MWVVTNNELYHHGVKGMRWGVRRYQNLDGTLTAAGKKRARKQEVKAAKKAAKAPHEDYQRAHSKKKVTKMSDKELRDVNNRLQMEKQFSQLTEKKKSAGRKFVSGVLATAATTVATGYAVKYMKQGIEYLAK